MTDDAANIITIQRPIGDADMFGGATWQSAQCIIGDMGASKFSITLKLNFPSGHHTGYVTKNDYQALLTLFRKFHQERSNVPLPRRRATRSQSNIKFLMQFFDAGQEVVVAALPASLSTDKTFSAAFRAGIRFMDLRVTTSGGKQFRGVVIFDGTPSGRHLLSYAKKDSEIAGEVFEKFQLDRTYRYKTFNGQRILG